MTVTRLSRAAATPLNPGVSPAETATPATRVSPGGATGRTSGETRAAHPANDAWEALLSAHATLMRQFGAQDVWEDLSVKEYDVLYTLSKCPQPIRLTELNRHVLLSQPALSRLVDRLAERGLVSRTADPSDGRGLRLALTAEGGVVQRRIGRRHSRSVARAMLAELSPAELRQLQELCGRLAKARTRSE